MSKKNQIVVPYKARHFARRDRWQFFLLGVFGIYEGLVIALSLGYLTVDTRAWWLFREE